MNLKPLLRSIVNCNDRHAKWLNTLSYLENCGARKIAACEHPTLVKEEMLKHAAEEFRHAHYLKQQIKKVSAHPMDTYSLENMLGGFAALHYLSALDLKVCRFLKALNFSLSEVKEAAYSLVTYAIELRAAELYPAYEEVLREKNSNVFVKSIWLEELEHLNEMREGIKRLTLSKDQVEHICAIEGELCAKWLAAIS